MSNVNFIVYSTLYEEDILKAIHGLDYTDSACNSTYV